MIAKLKNFIKGRNEKGFTLIEIVLVMAIAGLIFVIVFLAVSQAQQARRDTQRSTDISRIAAQLEQYASNNNGTYPASATDFNSSFAAASTNYLPPDEYVDPLSGTVYGTNQEPSAGGEVNATSISGAGPTPSLQTPTNTEAGGIGYETVGSGNRGYRVCIGLEAGVRCQDTR